MQSLLFIKTFCSTLQTLFVWAQILILWLIFSLIFLWAVVQPKATGTLAPSSSCQELGWNVWWVPGIFPREVLPVVAEGYQGLHLITDGQQQVPGMKSSGMCLGSPSSPNTHKQWVLLIWHLSWCMFDNVTISILGGPFLLLKSCFSVFCTHFSRPLKNGRCFLGKKCIFMNFNVDVCFIFFIGGLFLK